MNQCLIVIYYNGRANYTLFVLFIDPVGLTLNAFESCSRTGGKSYWRSASYCLRWVFVSV